MFCRLRNVECIFTYVPRQMIFYYFNLMVPNQIEYPIDCFQLIIQNQSLINQFLGFFKINR
jgi:hypothetical protein